MKTTRDRLTKAATDFSSTLVKAIGYSPDRVLLDIAEEFLHEVTNDYLCTFHFCEGPDVRPVSMVTCSRCQRIHELRSVIGELTNTPYNTNSLPIGFFGKGRRGQYTVKSNKQKEV